MSVTPIKKQKAVKFKYADGQAVVDNNIILTNDVKMSLDNRYTERCPHILVVGGTGTGKTQYYVIPNILQANTSFVITDPKGEILRATGSFLKRMGYEIRVFNLIDMKNSSNYNPFNYVYDSQGEIDYNAVQKMVNVLFKNVTDGKEKSAGGDPFWDTQAEKLIMAISIMLLEIGGSSQKNFFTVAEKMRLLQVQEEPQNLQNKGKEKKNQLDIEFEELEKINPESLGVMLYREVKQASGKMIKSITSVANAKVQKFNFPNVKNLTHCDTLHIDTVGDKKTALFIIIPASDKTYNFLAGMMYTQMFDLLYNRANFKFGGTLPVPVRFILDEFANVGTIPNFNELISTMRSMGLTVNIILQDIAQLETMYDKSWKTIVANCDGFLFLGGTEETTTKLVSSKLGKETIDLTGKNRTKGRQNSTSENNSILGRELLLPDEVAKMNNKYCILMMRGYNPFYCKKYDVLKHPNFRYTERYDKNNAYNYRDIITKTIPVVLDKEKQKAETHKHIPEDINLTVKSEITGVQTEKKIIEIPVMGNLILSPVDKDIIESIQTFGTVTSSFAEENPSAIDIDIKNDGMVYSYGKLTGGDLNDLDLAFFENTTSETAENRPPTLDSVFSFSGQNNSDDEKQNLYNL